MASMVRSARVRSPRTSPGSAGHRNKSVLPSAQKSSAQRPTPGGAEVLAEVGPTRFILDDVDAFALPLPAGVSLDVTRYTFVIPTPPFPESEWEQVQVIARRGGWDRGPIVAWNITDHFGNFWTRARAGFVYRPEKVEDGRWATAEEALREAAEHAVPWCMAEWARDPRAAKGGVR